jgi:hypothetical protein
MEAPVRHRIRASGGNKLSSRLKLISALVPAFALVLGAASSQAAELSNEAQNAIPSDVRQLVVIDYRAMENSDTAMQLRDHVTPPELKQFEEAIRKSGINDNHDVDQLAFAFFHPASAGKGDDVVILGIAQGQFDTDTILAGFKKKGVKPTVIRTNKIYPMGKSGMLLCFVDQSTMVFGDMDAIKASLDARDGNTKSLLSNSNIMEAIRAVDSASLWSVLDATGTQNMMKQVLGEAGSVADFDSVRKRLQVSYYGMDFAHGVKFDLTIVTGDNFAAATISSLLNAAVVYKKTAGDTDEKAALAGTDVSSSAGQLKIHFAASDNEFSSLLKSSLFQSMVR